MKYIPIILLSIAVACNNHPNQHTAQTTPTDSLINNAGNNADAAHVAGAQLIAKNDCLTCHKIDQKIVGPSYRDIANRYDSVQGNIDMLAQKIIKGGKGAWDSTMMTAHPNLDPNDAETMVHYILSLRNNGK